MHSFKLDSERGDFLLMQTACYGDSLAQQRISYLGRACCAAPERQKEQGKQYGHLSCFQPTTVHVLHGAAAAHIN